MSYTVRVSQKWRFLPDSKINATNNKFKGYLPKKSLKKKFQNFWVTFRGAFFQLKFYYINRLSETSVKWSYQENSIFFSIFHYKTILFDPESEFSMKNVFFWGISCWCSSKIKKVEGGLISSNCSLWLPLPISLFFELHQHDVPQKNTFFIENSDSEEKSIVL